MEQTAMEISVRKETGKGPARRERMAGRIPGVLYGSGQSLPISANPKTVSTLLMQEGGRNKMLTLKGAGVEGRAVMIRDYQIDPVSRELLHVDFLEIDPKKKIRVTVPLNFVGRAAGVAEGGVLNIVERQASVRCLPNQIPKHLDVDVSALAIGDSIHLRDLQLPEGVEKMTHVDPTLVTVVPPTKEEELAPSLAPSAEPEVIKEKKVEAEGAEGAEGEKPPAKTAAPESKKEEKKK
jgi:large subunit ribosomal protein L25